MSHAIKVLFKSASAIPKCSSYGIFRYMCLRKDLTKLTLTPGPDFLLQNLKNAETPKHVLKIVSEHHTIMNSKHVLQALRTIFDLQKHGNSDVSMKAILRDPDFDRLCRKLKSHSGVIELNETIEALKVISYVGVPSSSTIVQVLLQLVRENINSLNLQHVMFLDFLLGNFNSCPLVDALKIALPLVFEIHLPIKMDKRNVAHLTEYLYYASRTTLSEKTVEIIVKALCDCDEEFDAKVAKSIVWSITDMEKQYFFEPLLNKAVNDLIVHIDDLNYCDMETTMSKLISSYSKKYPFFYNEVFLDTCANYIIDHDLGFKHAVYALRKLGRVYHINKHLLNYVSKKVLHDPSCIINADPSDIYSITVSLCLTNFRPEHWNHLKELIQKTKNLAAENRKEIIWIRFAASLCLLDIYKIDVLSRALNPEYLQHLLIKKGYISDFENYFAIWQSIKTFRPEMSDILPSKFEPEDIVDYMKPTSDFPLEAALQSGLGGESFVRTNLFSKAGARIDHAILFRKGGYPVPITEESKFIEDIELQQQYNLVLVLALKPISYTINTRTIRECGTLMIKVLESNGYIVVPINVENWEGLNDFERVPYLMQKIKNKLQDEVSIKENIM